MTKGKIAVCFIVVAAVLGASGCSTSENFSFPKQQITGVTGPAMKWEPEYYSYKNGKYEFVQGHYRPVVNRKQYFKRSLRGYMTKTKRGRSSG